MKRIKKQVGSLAVLVLALLLLTACTVSGKRVRKVPTANNAEQQTLMTGVVLQNDLENNVLQIRELDSDTVSTLSYDETAEVQDEYGQIRQGEDIGVGEILEVGYLPQEGKLAKAKVPKNAWSYDEVQQFELNEEENMLLLAGEKYRYGEQTYCSADGVPMQLTDFNNNDVLTVRGMGIQVYSIVRTKGHGYIRLVNYQDFMGGMASVGDEIIVPISQNMLITAGEGTYEVTLLKRGLAAKKTVLVAANMVTVVDFRDYKKDIKDIGEVVFDIHPDGAVLTINGTTVDYSNPVTLRFGKYRIVVSLAGYGDYVGILNVEKQEPETIHIELEEANAVISAATPTPNTSSSSSSQSSSSTTTRKYDSKHTITVVAPEGAEVYLNNVYKGLAPCTFTKVIGSQTITLSDTGFQTKSYTVDILDDDKNVSLSFADLVAEDAETESTETPEASASATASAD